MTRLTTFIIAAVGFQIAVSSANAQTSPKVALSASTVSKCDFARATGPQGEREVRINLNVGDAYNYGEVYGQVFFDLRRNGKETTAAGWFEGLQRALVTTGLFSEDREYIFAVGAFTNIPDGAGGMKRVDLGKQILYHFKQGQGGNLQLLTTNVQAGSRRVISTVEQEGLFPLTPRIEIIENTNAVQLEFEYYKSKQTKLEVGLIGKIVNSIAGFLGLGGAITFPQQQIVSTVINSATKPLQDLSTTLSETFEPIEVLKKVKSVGFLPGIALDMNNVAAYTVEIENDDRKTVNSYDVKVYAAVIPSIISNGLDESCRYPQYSQDPNSILKAAVTPKNETIEQFYKNDSIRRTFLAQLGTQTNKSNLIEACNSLKEDLRTYFGGFDVYAISWAILASRENHFADKAAARECLTSSERRLIYEKLKFPKLFEQT